MAQQEESVRGAYWAEIGKAWGKPFVRRTEVEAFTKGVLKGKTIANFDSRGEGPEGRAVLGRQCLYPTDHLVEWLISKSQARKK